MKKSWLSGVLMLLAVLPAVAQQVMYSNLKELVENRGDTVTTLKIEKRTKNQIYLMGGADYRITVDDNPGQWYVPAMWLGGKVYFCAQPVGQAATSTMTPDDATRLGGEVGDAINASGLVHARVYYELNPETGKSEFVGRERMMQLLAGYPTLHAEFEKETSESAEVIGKYLRALRPLITNH